MSRLAVPPRRTGDNPSFYENFSLRGLRVNRVEPGLIVCSFKDPNNKNVVNCDEKLKSILLGKPQVELAELPALIKLHFPKEPK